MAGRAAAEQLARPLAPPRAPTDWAKYVDALLEAVLILLLLATPLLISLDTTDACRVPQRHVSASLMLLVTGLWLAGALFVRQPQRQLDLPLLWPAGALLAWFAMATAASAAPRTSLRCSLLLALHVLVFWTIVDLTSRRPRARLRLVAAMLVPFALNAAAALLQYWQVDLQPLALAPLDSLVFLERTAKLGRVVGFLGNENMLGSYLVALLPFCVALASSRASGTAWQRGACGLGAALGVAAVLAALNRGAWLGMLLSAASLAALTFARYRGSIRQVVRPWVVTAVAVLLVLLVAATLLGPGRKRLLIRLDVTGAGSTSVVGRLIVWKTAAEMMQENPWTGLGPGTFGMHSLRFLAREFEGEGIPSKLTARFEQAHNEFVQLGAETGIPGLLLGLGGFALLLGVALRRALRAELEPDEFALQAAGASGLLAAGMTALTTFPLQVAASSVVFVTVAALTVCGSVCGARLALPARGRRVWIALPVAGACVAGLMGLADIYEADKLVRRGKELYQRKRADESEQSLRRALALDPERGDAWFSLARRAQQKRRWRESLELFERTLRVHDDATLHLYMGYSYEAIGDFDSARREFQIAMSYVPSKHKIHVRARKALEQLESRRPRAAP